MMLRIGDVVTLKYSGQKLYVVKIYKELDLVDCWYFNEKATNPSPCLITGLNALATSPVERSSPPRFSFGAGDVCLIRHLNDSPICVVNETIEPTGDLAQLIEVVSQDSNGAIQKFSVPLCALSFKPPFNGMEEA